MITLNCDTGLFITSDWQPSIWFQNNTDPTKFWDKGMDYSTKSFFIGPQTGGYGAGPQSGGNPLFILDRTGKMGLGLTGYNATPKAQVHVATGDVYIENIGSGIIMKSPNGTCWRMTVSNAGAGQFTSITCP